MRRLRAQYFIASALAVSAAAFIACATSNDDPARADDAGAQTIPGTDANQGDAGEDGDANALCSDGAPGCGPTVDCSAADFCAVPSPIPSLVALNAVWGSGPNDVWAVGTRGTLLHSEGSAFTAVKSDVTSIVLSVWGTGPNDVWILDVDSPLHLSAFHDGAATFERRPSPAWASPSLLHQVWTGFSLTPTDVWIGGVLQTVTNFSITTTGNFWELGPAPDGGADAGMDWNAASACGANECSSVIRGIWGTDASTLWAVGRGGQAYRFDGQGGLDGGKPHWTLQNTHTANALEAVWGSGPNDVWAVGHFGTILHTSDTPGTWSQMPSSTKANLHSIWGSGPGDVWAVGDEGTVLHFDGKSWTQATIGWPAGESPAPLFGVWGSGPDDVWIVGQGVILHRTATSRRQP